MSKLIVRLSSDSTASTQFVGDLLDNKSYSILTRQHVVDLIQALDFYVHLLHNSLQMCVDVGDTHLSICCGFVVQLVVQQAVQQIEAGGV